MPAWPGGLIKRTTLAGDRGKRRVHIRCAEALMLPRCGRRARLGMWVSRRPQWTRVSSCLGATSLKTLGPRRDAALQLPSIQPWNGSLRPFHGRP